VVVETEKNISAKLKIGGLALGVAMYRLALSVVKRHSEGSGGSGGSGGSWI
jgi:hypothetical protein